MGEVGEAGGALAADFPAFDQAFVGGFPELGASKAAAQGRGDGAVDVLGHSGSLNSGFIGQLRCARCGGW